MAMAERPASRIRRRFRHLRRELPSPRPPVLVLAPVGRFTRCRRDRQRLRVTRCPCPLPGTVPDPFIQPAPSSSRMQPSTSRDVFRSGRWTYAPRYGRWSAVSGGYAGGYGAYYDAGGYYGSLPTTQAPADLPQGRLALFVTPATTQVYVDGFYLGTVADFQDRGLWLESGPRRIELRADGYQTETFDVRIDEERSTEYRRDLTRSSARSDAPRVAANPKTFYVIPGCYAGDTPPQKNRLPDGCLNAQRQNYPTCCQSPHASIERTCRGSERPAGRPCR